MKKTISSLTLSVAALLVGTAISQAAPVTWTGVNSANWNDAGNWNSGLPSPGDNLIFAGNANTSPNNDFAPNTAFGGINFDPTATSGFDLLGAAINFAGVIENDSATAQSIDLPIVLTGASTINVTNGSINIGLNAGGISGTGPLTVNGTPSGGTLTVSNSTYSGGTTVNGANMIVENDNGSYTLAGGSLELTYGSWYSGANFSFTADSSLGVIAGGPNYNNRGRYDSYGTIGSPGFKWTVVGDGRFQIFGHVAAGSVEVTSPAVLGALGNGNVTGLGTNTITVDSGAALRINNGGIVLAPIVLDGGQGPDSQGALVANQEAYSGNTNYPVATFSNSITLLNDNGDTYFGAQTAAGNSIGSTMAIPGNISGPGGLQKIGPNLLSLSGSNSFAGNLTINTGLVQIGSSNAIPGTATVYVYGSSTLDLNGNAATATGLNDDGSGNGALDNSSATAASLSVNGASFVGQVKNSGGGPLSIINVSGTAQLLGANSYSGANQVLGGTLEINIPTGTTNGGLLQVADNTTLILHKTSPGSSLKASGAAIGTSGATTLTVDLANYANPTLPIINATNGAGVLAVNGTVSVNLENFATLISGQFPLIKYTTKTGSGTFVLASPLNAGISLSNNVANHSIDVVVTQPITTWIGYINNLWDYSTTNWVYKAVHTNYQDGLPILVDDTSHTNIVNLTNNVSPGSALSPGSLLVNTTNTYTFFGTSPLSGGTLTKNGSGTLILDVAGNSYASTTISGGTLQVGNNDSNGDLGSGNVDDEGSLVFNLTNNIAVANTISGAGAVTQNNTNTVTLSVANTFSGGTLVNQGILKLGNATALGVPSGSVIATVASGASLDLSGVNLSTPKYVAIAGNGATAGRGALMLSGGGMGCTIGCTVVGARFLRLTGDASIGDSSGDFQLGSDHNANPNENGLCGSLDGQGHSLTKIGNNTLIVEVTNASPLSAFNLAQGGAIICATATTPFGPNCPIVISNSAIMDTWSQYGGGGITFANNFTIGAGGATVRNTHGSYGGNEFDNYNGSFTLNDNLWLICNYKAGSTPGQININGPISGSNGIINGGSYAVSLTGLNTYSGPTVATNNNSLLLSTRQQGGGSYLIYDNSTLDVPLQTGYNTVPMSTLMVGSSTGGTLSLGRLTALSTINAPITATNLTVIGNSIVLLPPLAYSIVPGEYPLIKYTTAPSYGIAGTITIGGGVRGVSGYITNDVANSQIAFVVPGGTPVVWTGAGGNTWDINNTISWITNTGATIYQQSGSLGDVVTFNDSSSVTNVNIAVPVSPTAAIFNLTNKLYTLSGTNITGAAALMKNGPGTLVLSNLNNNFTAGTIVNAGTLQMASKTNGALNNLSGTVTVASGGTLDLGYNNPTAMIINASGAGVNGSGAIQANYPGSAAAYGPNTINQTGNLTIGGNNRWDLRQGSSKWNITPAAATVTKVGSSYVGVLNTPVSTNLGNLYILGGTLDFQQGTTGLTNLNNTIYIGNGGSLGFYQFYTPVTESIICSNGGSIIVDGGGGSPGTSPTTQNIISGPIYLAGTNTSVNPAQIACNYNNGCAISNTISGPGALTFNYNAYNRLYAPNTYQGDSQILGGVYMFANSSIVSTNNIYINGGPLWITNNATVGTSTTYINDNYGSLVVGGAGNLTFGTMRIGGATLDVTGRTNGTLTMASGETLRIDNGAIIKGNVVAGPGSTVAPGGNNYIQNTGTNWNNLTFQGGSTASMDISVTTTTNYDVIGVGGTLTYGGTLSIIRNGATAFSAGQSFKLFAAGSYSGAFATISTNIGGQFVAWNTSQLAVNGTLTVASVTSSSKPALTNSFSAGALTLSWAADHVGWSLQVQTNSLSTGLSNNWVTVPGSSSVNSVTIPVDPANGAVFYRLSYP